MSYTDNVAAAQESTFQAAVSAGMVKYALGVAAEDPTTADHVNRLAFANKVIQSPNGWTPQFALAVAVQMGAVLAAIRPLSDAEIDAAVDTAVAAVWPAFSG